MKKYVLQYNVKDAKELISFSDLEGDYKVYETRDGYYFLTINGIYIKLLSDHELQELVGIYIEWKKNKEQAENLVLVPVEYLLGSRWAQKVNPFNNIMKPETRRKKAQKKKNKIKQTDVQDLVDLLS